MMVTFHLSWVALPRPSRALWARGTFRLCTPASQVFTHREPWGGTKCEAHANYFFVLSHLAENTAGETRTLVSSERLFLLQPCAEEGPAEALSET
jgi:hypothetical protein